MNLKTNNNLIIYLSLSHFNNHELAKY
jgi:hypothetical protein